MTLHAFHCTTPPTVKDRVIVGTSIFKSEVNWLHGKKKHLSYACTCSHVVTLMLFRDIINVSVGQSSVIVENQHEVAFSLSSKVVQS